MRSTLSLTLLGFGLLGLTSAAPAHLDISINVDLKDAADTPKNGTASDSTAVSEPTWWVNFYGEPGCDAEWYHYRTGGIKEIGTCYEFFWSPYNRVIKGLSMTDNNSGKWRFAVDFYRDSYCRTWTDSARATDQCVNPNVPAAGFAISWMDDNGNRDLMLDSLTAQDL